MLLGTVTFLFGRRMLGELGLAPAGAAVPAAHEAAAAPARPLRLGPVLGVGVLPLAVGIWLALRQPAGANLLSVIDPILWSAAVSVCLAVYVFLRQRCSPQEMSRITAIYVIAAFVMFFWAAFEQAGSSLTLFADKLTDCSVFGSPFPSSWFQSANAIFIVALAPIFSSIWTLLAARSAEPSTPTKMVWGILWNAASFAVILPAAFMASASDRVGPEWLTILYFLQTCGELCLSPVGLSMVTKLAPARYAAMLMGVWFFVANAFGNKIAGSAAAWMEAFGPVTLFALVAGVLGGAAVVLMTLVPWLRQQMGGVH
jgi:POT family proton-dependent oligopeptide transporter